MHPLHNLIMSAVKSQPVADNNVKQNTKPFERFRLVPATRGITLSDELLAQLDRFCAANPVTPRTKPNAQPMSRSKAIRRAVYALMENHRTLHRTPNQLPSIGLPPDRRTRSVSWTMPQNRPADIQRFDEVCTHLGLKQFNFVRRAIYLYTVAHKSTDREEAIKAASDAWY